MTTYLKLYSNCCNAEDGPSGNRYDMYWSEIDICPKCGSHCSFENWEIIEELEQVATGNDLISFTIRQAIENGASFYEIVDYIKSQAKDNKAMMTDIIGESLTNKILMV